VTFIVHASKDDEVAITVRLRAVAAIAKAQSLSAEGWNVVIIGPDDTKYSPAQFDRLLALSAP
jgi:ubiquitin-protein ligase